MASVVDAMAGVDHATGAARRRRQRRLRAHWRHEQLSLQMLLATYEHHATPRGQSKARSRGEESEMNNAFGQKTPPPRAASTVHFDLFDEGEVLAARPTPLVEVRPQLGVQRHSAEQVIETFVPVQVLDAPVPQVGEVHVVEFMREFDVPVVAEPVIEVPKISLDKVPRHRMVDLARPPQTAEQLVHVPTIISYSSLQRTVVQTLTFQFLGFGEEVAEVFKVFALDRALQQRTWSRSLIFQFLSVVGGELVVFKVLSLDRFQQRIWSRSLVFLHVEVLQVFSQDRVLPHRAVCLSMPMKEFNGIFALFSVPEKVRGWVRTRGRN